MMPKFQDPAAIERWNAYFAEVDRLLPVTDDAEMRTALRAHLADGFAAGDVALGEAERLDRAIERLGRPADYLPMIADAPRRRDPIAIGRGLYRATRTGATRTLRAAGFTFGYAMLAIFAAMAVLKPVWGDHVGLFRQADGRMSFGIIANADGAPELLGLWIMPLAFAAAGLLYAVLTRAARSVAYRPG